MGRSVVQMSKQIFQIGQICSNNIFIKWFKKKVQMSNIFFSDPLNYIFLFIWTIFCSCTIYFLHICSLLELALFFCSFELFFGSFELFFGSLELFLAHVNFFAHLNVFSHLNYFLFIWTIYWLIWTIFFSFLLTRNIY